MKTLRLLTLIGVCCATGTLATGAWAAESPTAKAADQPAAESAPPQTDEPSPVAQSSKRDKGTQGDESAVSEEETQTAARPKGSGKGGSPDRFTPSEQVRADFDVSFPIDI